jgi:hypothetical protein
MSSRSEVLSDRSICGEKPLRMTRRLEPLHTPLPLASGLVRMLGAVIQIVVLSMLDTRQELAHGGTVASQLICDDHAWDVPHTLEQFAEECLGGVLVAPALHQNIEYLAMLIHGPPQIMSLPLHRQKDRIQMPLVPRSRALAAELLSIGLPEFPAPIPHRFIGQDDATFRHELFDIPIAEAEAVIAPYAVADDLYREPMALIQVDRRSCVHAVSMACGGGAGQMGSLI